MRLTNRKCKIAKRSILFHLLVLIYQELGRHKLFRIQETNNKCNSIKLQLSVFLSLSAHRSLQKMGLLRLKV